LSAEVGDVATFVGLLRAVNVAGRKLTTADLLAVTESVGGRDVRTYLQTGNVIFDGSAAAARRLPAALSEHCGFDVAVLLRTPADLAAVVRRQPFRGEARQLHVTFLDRAPASERLTALDPGAFTPDVFRVDGTTVYLHVPDGYGRSKLSNAFFEKKLGVVATTRNWNTTRALADLSERR
jgi:uncharacterized protein (DUF1697 family)